MAHGTVYIIGAGPGDPDLITCKGLKCIQECDVLFHDRSVSPALLREAPETAETIAIVDTITDEPTMLDRLNKRIVSYAIEGKKVGVVAEGDPFIFGLGAEIAREVSHHKIPFVVIPGVTSAIAAAAYAGIPLTFRGYSSTMAFATGHTDLNKKYTDVDWQKVATGISTLVFFMGLSNLSMIVQNLITHGRDRRTPAAIVSKGTTDEQKTIVSTLGGIASMIETENIDVPVPAIIIVGDVVGLHNELNWFERDQITERTARKDV
jgi:uroporphyrinogen III methyltransferase / synthase